jgi:hypothetical protein
MAPAATRLPIGRVLGSADGSKASKRRALGYLVRIMGGVASALLARNKEGLCRDGKWAKFTDDGKREGAVEGTKQALVAVCSDRQGQQPMDCVDALFPVSLSIRWRASTPRLPDFANGASHAGNPFANHSCGSLGMDLADPGSNWLVAAAHLALSASLQSTNSLSSLLQRDPSPRSRLRSFCSARFQEHASGSVVLMFS